MLYFIKEEKVELKFGFIDLIVLIAGLLGYWRGKKRGVFLSLYKVITLLVGVFMFYRFSYIFKGLSQRLNSSFVYGIALLVVVLAVLLIFKIFWFLIYRFIDLRPALGISEVVAGIIGAFYGLLWAGIILRALYYGELEAIKNIVGDTLSARFILPLPLFSYKVITKLGMKIFALPESQGAGL